MEPASNKLHADSEEHVTELITILTMILREASLLPETDFLATLELAFARGLAHKLSTGRPYDELDAAFGEDIHAEFQKSQYNTPGTLKVARLERTTSCAGMTEEDLPICKTRRTNCYRRATRILPVASVSLWRRLLHLMNSRAPWKHSARAAA